MPVRPAAAAGYVLAAVGVLAGIAAFALTALPTDGSCTRILDPPELGRCVLEQLERRRQVMIVAAAGFVVLCAAVWLLVRQLRHPG